MNIKNNREKKYEKTIFSFLFVMLITIGCANDEKEPAIYVSVYDNETKEFIGCKSFITSASTTTKNFDIDCVLESGKTYLVKAMMFNKDQKPLINHKEINLVK